MGGLAEIRKQCHGTCVAFLLCAWWASLLYLIKVQIILTYMYDECLNEHNWIIQALCHKQTLQNEFSLSQKQGRKSDIFPQMLAQITLFFLWNTQ
jgi:hypothetical protein